MPLPRLDPVSGCLPARPLFHDATLEDVAEAFGHAFPGSTRRPMIHAAYVQHEEAALPLIAREPREQWMDGSFTTAKAEPGDVDVVTYVPKAVLDALSALERLTIWDLFDGGRPGCLCHAFVVPVPEGATAEEREAFRLQRQLWTVLFRQQRPEDGGHPKGIVRLRVGGP